MKDRISLRIDYEGRAFDWINDKGIVTPVLIDAGRLGFCVVWYARGCLQVEWYDEAIKLPSKKRERG